MYIVTIQDGNTQTEIHNEHYKLMSGSIVKGINTIDSFSFTVLPDNPGFGNLKDFTTLVTVYNTRRKRYEFQGRVLCTSTQMNANGLITQEATCESLFGFLCDSIQPYIEEKNWTVYELLYHIITTHNAQVEEYKRFNMGTVDVPDPPDGLLVGLQRENSWDAIMKKLVEKVGGELSFKVVNGNTFIDYKQSLGAEKTTEIALSRNMKSIIKEKDPSAFITRLIPLGAKISDGSEERLDITSINNGKNYIDDIDAIAEYGIHVGYAEFDDVTDASTLWNKGQEWLKNNNKVLIKYSITALDLSILGLDMDDFEVCNTYPLKNKLLGIDDKARINKKTIDVCDESKTTIEIGESFKSLSELQREQMVSLNKVSQNITDIIRNYATNEKLTAEINRTLSVIEQTENRIRTEVSQTYITGSDIAGYLNGYVTADDLLAYATASDLEATVEKLSSQIIQTKDTITASVEQNYAKVSALDNYATLEKLSSEIEIAKSSINLSVSQTIDNIAVGGRNYILYGKGDKRKGFFQYFTRISNGCGERTLSRDSTTNYAKQVNIAPGFILGCSDYSTGKTMTLSFDIMITNSNAISEWKIRQYCTDTEKTKYIFDLPLPRVGVNGCELNQWFHFEKTITVPKIVGATTNECAYIEVISTSSSKDIITFCIKNVKLEYGNKATDWTPSLEENEDTFATKAELALTIENGVSKLSAYADKMLFEANQIEINTDFFTLSPDGAIVATKGNVGAWDIGSGYLRAEASYKPEGSNTFFKEAVELSPIGVRLWVNDTNFNSEPREWATWNNLIARIEILYNDFLERKGQDVTLNGPFQKWW